MLSVPMTARWDQDKKYLCVRVFGETLDPTSPLFPSSSSTVFWLKILLNCSHYEIEISRITKELLINK